MFELGFIAAVGIALAGLILPRDYGSEKIGRNKDLNKFMKYYRKLRNKQVDFYLIITGGEYRFTHHDPNVNIEVVRECFLKNDWTAFLGNGYSGRDLKFSSSGNTLIIEIWG